MTRRTGPTVDPTRQKSDRYTFVLYRIMDLELILAAISQMLTPVMNGLSEVNVAIGVMNGKIGAMEGKMGEMTESLHGLRVVVGGLVERAR